MNIYSLLTLQECMIIDEMKEKSAKEYNDIAFILAYNDGSKIEKVKKSISDYSKRVESEEYK